MRLGVAVDGLLCVGGGGLLLKTGLDRVAPAEADTFPRVAVVVRLDLCSGFSEVGRCVGAGESATREVVGFAGDGLAKVTLEVCFSAARVGGRNSGVCCCGCIDSTVGFAVASSRLVSSWLKGRGTPMYSWNDVEMSFRVSGRLGSLRAGAGALAVELGSTPSGSEPSLLDGSC